MAIKEGSIAASEILNLPSIPILGIRAWRLEIVGDGMLKLTSGLSSRPIMTTRSENPNSSPVVGPSSITNLMSDCDPTKESFSMI